MNRNPDFEKKEKLFEQAQKVWQSLPIGLRIAGEALVFVPVLGKGLACGIGFPDLDLVLPGVGIGGHRWAVTHSALAAYFAKTGVEILNRYVKDDTSRTFLTKTVSAASLGFCMGISIHLLKDAFFDGNQSVRFVLPFLGGPGTIIEGTYIDDDSFLAANGLLVLRTLNDILLLGFGAEIAEVRAAWQRYVEDKNTRVEIERARAACRTEIARLRQELDTRIPTDKLKPVSFPSFISDFPSDRQVR